MNLPAQEHQHTMVKGKPMFDSQPGMGNDLKQRMQNSSHGATQRGLKKKRHAQARYLGQDNKRYSKAAIEHALKG